MATDRYTEPEAPLDPELLRYLYGTEPHSSQAQGYGQLVDIGGRKYYRVGQIGPEYLRDLGGYRDDRYGFLVPRESWDQYQDQQKGGFWDGPGPFLLALGGLGAVAGPAMLAGATAEGATGAAAAGAAGAEASGSLAALAGAADPIEAIAMLDTIGGGAGATAGAQALGYGSVTEALGAMNPAWASVAAEFTPPTGQLNNPTVGVQTPTGGTVPDWLKNLFPGVNPGSLLSALLASGLGLAGADAQREAITNLANQQRSDYGAATNAYYDAVNRQTGAYEDATAAYRSREDLNRDAYKDSLARYDDLIGLQTGAYGDARQAYDDRVAAEERSYQTALDLYGGLRDDQRADFDTQLGLYGQRRGDELTAYENSRQFIEGLVGREEAAYQGALGRYDQRREDELASYMRAQGMHEGQIQTQLQAYRDARGAYQTEVARRSALGEPYRDRLAGLYADPESFLSSAEVQVPVRLATDAMARSLSTRGNPTGSGTALQELQNYSANQLFGRLGEERDRLGVLGGLTGAAYSSPEHPNAPTPLQNYPTLGNYGAIPMPNYTANYPTLGSYGAIPQASYSQAFPTLGTPGAYPTPNFSSAFPQPGSPGSFPTMPNSPTFPQPNYSGLTGLAGTAQDPYNAIATAAGRALNPTPSLEDFFRMFRTQGA